MIKYSFFSFARDIRLLLISSALSVFIPFLLLAEAHSAGVVVTHSVRTFDDIYSASHKVQDVRMNENSKANLLSLSFVCILFRRCDLVSSHLSYLTKSK